MFRPTPKALTLLLVLSGATLAGQSLATQYPLTLKDDLGNSVTFSSEPQRIVSALPSTTETLCALGACAKLVGVDTYSNYPPEVNKLPHVADLFTPNVEAVVALKPDLVLVNGDNKLAQALQALGVRTFALEPQTYQDVFTKTATLGRIVNREVQAKNLINQIRRGVARVEVLTAGAKKVKTYYEIDPTPYSVGPNSFIGVLLSKAGAQNIIPESLGNYPQISPELVVQQNPALMLGLDLATAQKRPGWGSIAAVKTRQVFQIPKELQDPLNRPGPRLPQALLGLARLIHPELFQGTGTR